MLAVSPSGCASRSVEEETRYPSRESTRMEASGKASEGAHGMAHVSQLNFEAEEGPMPDMPWIQEMDDGGVDNTGEMASVSDPVDPNKQPERSSPIKGQNLAIFTDDASLHRPAVEAEADGAAAGLELEAEQEVEDDVVPAVLEAEPGADCGPAELEAEPEANAAVELGLSRRRPRVAGDESDWQFGEKIDDSRIQCLACRKVIRGDLSHLRRHLTRCKALTSCLQPTPLNTKRSQNVSTTGKCKEP